MIVIKPVGVEVKRFILTRKLAQLLYVEPYDVTIIEYVERKTGVTVTFRVNGDGDTHKQMIPWWTLVTTT
jgi:hypothetical protein